MAEELGTRALEDQDSGVRAVAPEAPGQMQARSSVPNIQSTLKSALQRPNSSEGP